MDCQAGVGLAGSTEGGGPQAALHLNGALEDSVAAHFPGNHCINCMCHSTENLYRWGCCLHGVQELLTGGLSHKCCCMLLGPLHLRTGSG